MNLPFTLNDVVSLSQNLALILWGVSLFILLLYIGIYPILYFFGLIKVKHAQKLSLSFKLQERINNRFDMKRLKAEQLKFKADQLKARMGQIYSKEKASVLKEAEKILNENIDSLDEVTENKGTCPNPNDEEFEKEKVSLKLNHWIALAKNQEFRFLFKVQILKAIKKYDLVLLKKLVALPLIICLITTPIYAIILEHNQIARAFAFTQKRSFYHGINSPLMREIEKENFQKFLKSHNQDQTKIDKTFSLLDFLIPPVYADSKWGKNDEKGEKIKNKVKDFFDKFFSNKKGHTDKNGHEKEEEIKYESKSEHEEDNNKSKTTFSPGVIITPNKIMRVVNEGENVEFSGTLCYQEKQRIRGELPHCGKLRDFKFRRRYFFPSTLTEITDQVTEVDSPNGTNFSFTSTPINKMDQNVLTVLVESSSKPIIGKLILKSKFELLIQKLTAKLENANDHKREGLEEAIAFLNKISQNIQAKIDESLEVVAQYELPLSVESNVASPLFYSSLFGDIRQSAKVALGVPFEGESSIINANVKKLTKDEVTLSNSSNGKSLWNFGFIWNEQVLSSEQRDRFKRGDEVSFSGTLSGVSPLSANLFEIEVTRTPGGHQTGHDNRKLDRFGDFELMLPVITDSIGPKWAVSPIPSDTFTNSPINFSAEVRDDIGRINRDLLAVELQSTLSDGSVVQGNALDLFLIEALEAETDRDLASGVGSSAYRLTSQLDSLPDGLHEFYFYAQDFAMTPATPNPFIVSYVVDSIPPSISVNEEGGRLTNNNNISLAVTVSDFSPIEIIEIYINEELKASGSGTELLANLSLTEGESNIRIVAKDKANNSSEYMIPTIIVDSIAPVISTNAQSNLFTANSSYSYNYTISDASNITFSALHNGVEAQNVTTKQGSLNFILNEQNNKFEAKVVDAAGNETFVTLADGVVLDTIAPTLASSTQGNLRTNTSNFPINFSAQDTNNVTVEIFQNSNLIFTSTSKEGSFNATLVQDSNEFTLIATDVVGHKSQPITISNIILDTDAAEIAISSPSDGEFIFQTDFSLEAKVNEELSSLSINGEDALALLAQDLSLRKDFSSLPPGFFNVMIEAVDLAGNTSSQSLDVRIITKEFIGNHLDLINQELISLSHVAGSDNIQVTGAANSAKPSLKLLLDAGPSNQKEVIVATDGSFSETLAVFDTVKISVINQAPIAQLNVPASITVGQTASFDASASSDLEGDIVEYSFVFSDNDIQIGSSPNISKTFNIEGDQSVSLMVKDSDGLTATVTKSFIVETSNEPPIAAFNCSSSGLDVSCNSSGSSDSDGQINQRFWSATGVSETLGGISQNFSFPSDGTYSITLRVVDDKGAEDSLTKDITVVSGPTRQGVLPNIMANFSCTPDVTNVPTGSVTCTWDDSPTEVPISRFTWSYPGQTSSVTTKSVTFNVSQSIFDTKGRFLSASAFDADNNYVKVFIPMAINDSAPANSNLFIEALDSGCDISGRDLTCNAPASFIGAPPVTAYASYFNKSFVNMTTSPIMFTYDDSVNGDIISISLQGNKNSSSISYEIKTKMLVNPTPIVHGNIAPEIDLTAGCTLSGGILDCEGDKAATDPDGYLRRFDYKVGFFTTSSKNFSRFVGNVPGITVELSVRDNENSTVTKSQFIEASVDNAPPIVSFSCIPVSPLNIECKNGSTQDPDGIVTQLEWFANGVFIGSDDLITYVADQEGQVSIELKATDDQGAVGSKTVQVNALEAAFPPTIVISEFEGPFINNGSTILTDKTFQSYQWKVGSNVQVTTEYKLNGVTQFTNNFSNFNFSVNISQNTTNLVEIISNDNFGNSETFSFTVINDTAPPEVIASSPEENTTVFEKLINASITLNEMASITSFTQSSGPAVANREILSSEGENHNFEFFFPVDGDYTFRLEFKDQANNTLVYNYSLTVRSKLINIALIDTEPTVDGDRVEVVGLPGASIPGVEISGQVGIFGGSDSSLTAADGSFKLNLPPFSSLNLTAVKQDNGRTESETIQNDIDTTLSGVVRDSIDNFPIPGVVVKIVGTGQMSTTDGNGIFTIPNPPPGRQILEVDGGAVPSIITNGTREYAKFKYNVQIAAASANVLERVVYFTPLLKDGTETDVLQNSDTLLTSVHAPGVELHIKAGTATFPNGSKSGKMNMAIVSADRIPLPTPEFATPSQVISLEPSGVEFSDEVQVTLPNFHEFPEGLDVVIHSLNTLTGHWEVNGVAQVDAGGGTITTKPGQGISHYSYIYMAPLGPSVEQVGGDLKPGTNNFNGNVGTSITLPSYKVLGENIAPTLFYKSNWALPSLDVTSSFDAPDVEINRTSGGVFTPSSYVIGEVAVEEKGWFLPDEIDVTLRAPGLVTGNKFRGAPNKSILSFSANLSNLDSGFYPFIKNYRIQYKGYTTTTRTTTLKAREDFVFFEGGKQTLVQTQTSNKDHIYSSIYPPDESGSFFIQNYANSSIGKGWRLGGYQKIINPGGNVLAVENEDGSISPYQISSEIIETVHFEDEGMNAADISNWPVIAYGTDSDKIIEFDASSQSENLVKALNSYTGEVAGGARRGLNKFSNTGTEFIHDVDCRLKLYDYEVKRDIKDIKRLPNGRILWSDNFSIMTLDGGSERFVVGRLQSFVPQRFSELDAFLDLEPNLSPNIVDWATNNDSPFYKPTACDGESTVCTFKDIVLGSDNPSFSNTVPTSDRQLSIISQFPECYAETQGQFPSRGNFRVPNSSPDHELTSGFPENISFLVTHDGNFIFGSDKVNVETGETVALQENEYKIGPFTTPTSSPILIAREDIAVGLDSSIYIAGGKSIRKLDINGNTTIFIPQRDKALEPIDITTADDIALSDDISSLALDKDHNLLYIADNGHNRILKVDLNNNFARVIAGNGICDGSELAIGDGEPATLASLCNVQKLSFDDSNNLLIFEKGRNRVRRVLFTNSPVGKIEYKALAQDNSKMERLEDGSFVRSERAGTKHVFNSVGQHIRSESLTGRVTTFEYNPEGNLVKFIDPVGRETQYFYSGGKLASILDPIGRETSFVHNGDDLEEVIFPDSTRRSFVYDLDGKGLLTQEINEKGDPTSFIYNQVGKLEKTIGPDNSEVRVSDTVSQSSGGEGINDIVEFGSADNSLHDKFYDGNNNETKVVKDENGFASEIIDAEGNKTIIERNELGAPVKITRQDGSIVTFEYDSITQDLLKKTDSSTGIELTAVYDSFGNVTSSKNPRGFVSTSSYDPVTGLLLSSTNALGKSVSIEYSNLGLVSSRIDQLGNRTEFEYDSYGNLVLVRDSLLNETKLERDNAGNVIKITNAENQVIRREYDSYNRLTAVISAKNERTEYLYSDGGELIEIKDPLGNKISFEHDAFGRITKKIDQLNQVTERLYDDNGNIIREVDPKLNEFIFEYDNLNRLKKRIAPDKITFFDYDIRNNLNFISDGVTQANYVYETFESGDLVSSITTQGIGSNSDLPNYTVEYDHDANGNRIAMQGPQGLVTYEFDELDRQTRLENHKGEIFDFSFDDKNRLTQITRPGSHSSFSFDTTSFLTSIIHNNGPSEISKFIYQRNNIGNRTKITTNSGDHNINYDDNNQITSATNPEASNSFSNEVFSYDEIGNRDFDQDFHYQYDQTKQLLEEDNENLYVYDLNGNLTSKQSKLDGKVSNYSYNSDNQLVHLEFFDGATKIKEVFYSYDVLNRRVEKVVTDIQNTSKSFTRRYLYDGGEIIQVLDETNTTLVTYTHSNLETDDILSSDITSAGVLANIGKFAQSYFMLKDGQGSIVEITNSSGSIVQHYSYSIFGKLLSVTDGNHNEISGSPEIQPFFTYTGREYDSESSMYYYRARYYEPALGRFLTSDPHPGSLSRPITVTNSYIYTANNPANLVDPSGAIFGKIKESIKRSGKDFGRALKEFSRPENVKTFLVISAAFAATAFGFSLGPAGLPIIKAAITGAVLGGAIAAIQGRNIGEGALNGAISGAISASFAIAGQEIFVFQGAEAGGELSRLGGGLFGGATSFGFSEGTGGTGRENTFSFATGFVGGIGGFSLIPDTISGVNADQQAFENIGNSDAFLPQGSGSN